MIRSLVSKLLLLAIVAVIGGLFFLVSRHTGGSVASAPVQEPVSSSPMAISGFGFSIYEGASLATRVQADLFRIVPRKFGLFRLRSVNEASLVHARFEIYLTARGAQNAAKDRGVSPGQRREQGVFSAMGREFNSSAEGVPGMKGTGNVSRAVMDGLELAFYRGSFPWLEARAAGGDMDFRKKQIKMHGAVLEHLPSGKKIITETLLWDDGARVFKIPGSYEAITPKGRAKGRGITVDLDFHVEKMPVGAR